MSYKLSFRDKTEVIVPNETGEKLKSALMRAKPPRTITIAGELYKSSEVLTIKKTNLDTGQAKAKVLEPGTDCNTDTSIQWAVHRYIMANHKKNWKKLVKNQTFREKVRQAIIANDSDKIWCDHKAGAHACLELTAEEKQKARLRNMFETQDAAKGAIK
jgi:hypothetical protein